MGESSKEGLEGPREGSDQRPSRVEAAPTAPPSQAGPSLCLGAKLLQPRRRRENTGAAGGLLEG